MTMADLKKIPVEVGLQTEKDYPHKGTLDYAAPSGQSVHRYAAVARHTRKCRPRAAARLFRARARAARADEPDMLLVPDRAIGSDQSGRYVLVVGKDNVVEQRNVESASWSASCGSSQAASTAEDRVIVSGLLRPCPARRSSRRLKTARRGRALTARRNDLEILHRAAGSGERPRDPDGRDRHRVAAPPAGRAISRRRAADRAGDDPLSRRQRAHGRSTPSRCRSSSRSTASRA